MRARRPATSSAGTACRSASKPKLGEQLGGALGVRRVVARAACRSGTCTSACRKRTSSSKCASTQRVELFVRSGHAVSTAGRPSAGLRRPAGRAGAANASTASCMSSLVLDSSGLWLMPGVLAAHEQHRLRHHLVQLHRVVAGAARHAVHRQAGRRDRAFPALLPLGRARRGGGAHRLLEPVAAGRAARRSPAARASTSSRAGVAHLVGRGADVEAELAAARGSR